MWLTGAGSGVKVDVNEWVSESDIDTSIDLLIRTAPADRLLMI
jgi:undecaprenyl pyrophosphate synthase